MLPSRGLFQPYGRIALQGARSCELPGGFATVVAPISPFRSFKSTVLLDAGTFPSSGSPRNTILRPG
jgi:hypothetical protein